MIVYMKDDILGPGGGILGVAYYSICRPWAAYFPICRPRAAYFPVCRPDPMKYAALLLLSNIGPPMLYWSLFMRHKRSKAEFEPWPPAQNPGDEGGRRGHRQGVRAAADGEVVDLEPADQDEGDHSIEDYFGLMISVQNNY